jgi:hypothetical protein
MHLVGFTIEMYYDARPFERQIHLRVLLINSFLLHIEDQPIFCSVCGAVRLMVSHLIINLMIIDCLIPLNSVTVTSLNSLYRNDNYVFLFQCSQKARDG